MDTQYMTMMLALDDISMVYGILAKFFAWVFARGFRRTPGNVFTLADDQHEGGYGYGREGPHRRGDPVATVGVACVRIPTN